MNFRRTLPESRCLSLDCRRWSGTVLLFLLFGWSFFCRSLFGGLLQVGFLGRRLFHHLLGRSLPGWSLPGGCLYWSLPGRSFLGCRLSRGFGGLLGKSFSGGLFCGGFGRGWLGGGRVCPRGFWGPLSAREPYWTTTPA